MAAAGYCYTCRSHYHGGVMAHLGTKRHQLAVFRRDHPAGSRKSAKARARGESARRIRRLGSYQGQEHVKVKRHRRRRPLNGPGRVVRVDSYFRWNWQRYRG